MLQDVFNGDFTGCGKMRNTSEMAAVRGFNTFARSVTFPAIATTNILVELGGILHVSLIGTPHISWNRVSKEAAGLTM